MMGTSPGDRAGWACRRAGPLPLAGIDRPGTAQPRTPGRESDRRDDHRSVLVPAGMKLLGRWKCYLPSGLAWLPARYVEHEIA